MICQVCDRNEAIGVCSSPFGPMSCAYCLPCLYEHAEPESTFEYLYSFVGKKGEGLVPIWATTYKDGNYITWDKWVVWRRLPEQAHLDEKIEDGQPDEAQEWSDYDPDC